MGSGPYRIVRWDPGNEIGFRAFDGFLLGKPAIDDLRIKPDYPALIAALEKCEFKSLLQEVREEAARATSGNQAELKL